MQHMHMLHRAQLSNTCQEIFLTRGANYHYASASYTYIYAYAIL